MSWQVKHERPEDNSEPGEYFHASSYETSGMRRTQEQLTQRALELLAIPPKSRVLDVGCGTGFSMKVIENQGHTAVGIDIVESMIEKARERGLNAVVADMADLPFEKDSFDAIVSISVIQWAKDLKAVAKEFKRVLKPKGGMVAQFYPFSEDEAKSMAKIFASQGFQGGLAIDQPEHAKKRKVFLVMKLV
ncbi:class I SAM-dependent methyltransferase [archaeon]|nr:class I SAM-dependent methyltransferase [archaeon]